MFHCGWTCLTIKWILSLKTSIRNISSIPVINFLGQKWDSILSRNLTIWCASIPIIGNGAKRCGGIPVSGLQWPSGHLMHTRSPQTLKRMWSFFAFHIQFFFNTTNSIKQFLLYCVWFFNNKDGWFYGKIENMINQSK